MADRFGQDVTEPLDESRNNQPTRERIKHEQPLIPDRRQMTLDPAHVAAQLPPPYRQARGQNADGAGRRRSGLTPGEPTPRGEVKVRLRLERRGVGGLAVEAR